MSSDTGNEYSNSHAHRKPYSASLSVNFCIRETVDGLIMKIPETSANVGAYYGNEENGQWQPNGVIIDSGVGGGVVGSGDAGVQRAPLYPVHLPREHIPGYVMAGAYYPPAYPAAPVPDDFADYMWMENEEEFDKQVMQQLEEEALMEQCIEAMLEDEQRERHRPNGHHPQQYPTASSSNGASLSLEETVSRSRLNPLAAEFVPTAGPAAAPPHTAAHTATHTEEKCNIPEVSPAEPPPQRAEEAPAEHTHTHTEPHTDPTPPPSDPPEVSAADIQTDDKRRDKHKKPEPKKPAANAKDKPKPKPVQAKSDSKLVKKEDKKRDGKEIRLAKSEDVVDESTHESKPQPAPVEEPSGPKPINYAAAAKANKPKAKPTSPPATDKASPPPALLKQDKKKADKPAIKTDKPVQRKNSAK